MSEKSEKIYEAVTNISDELVESAGAKRKKPRRAWYISAVAACWSWSSPRRCCGPGRLGARDSGGGV